MSENMTTHQAKVTINGEKMPVHLSINWDGLSEDAMKELAARSIIIKWQNETRNSGEVPENRTEVNAVDFALGRARKPMDPMKALSMLTPEQLTELLKSKGLD